MADHTRWLSREAAAAYLDLSIVAFNRRVSAGDLPKASAHLGARCLRWDRLELDARMARSAASAASTGASGLASKILEKGRARRYATAQGR
ncbi:helix-turn-helix transcriptional regulator [Roseomonas chloroacetimidivorans]|uniref:helix-turn-helix transcriptional regulator n=1 Tax=Roseomonas chloroacetimidivorans TaxID=1766656 RepID=UPI003C75D49B